MTLSVVIPMYNERAVIAGTLRALAEALEKTASAAVSGEDAPFERYEILVSDDGSDDGSGGIVRETGKTLSLPHGSLRLLTSRENHGKGRAVRDGMRAAKGELRLFTDSDLAYGTDVIAAMAAEARRTGADVLIGSRAADPDGYAGYPLPRRLASRAYRALVARAAGIRCSDSQCGCKLFTGKAAGEIFSRTGTDGWAFDLEALLLADRLGFSVGEFPVRVLNHRASKVRLLRDGVKMAVQIARIRRRVRRMPQSP